MSRLIDNSSQTLEQALKNTLPQTDRVDVLTAYFYFSGFSLLECCNHAMETAR
jgi:hypothetical protein